MADNGQYLPLMACGQEGNSELSDGVVLDWLAPEERLSLAGAVLDPLPSGPTVFFQAAPGCLCGKFCNDTRVKLPHNMSC